MKDENLLGHDPERPVPGTESDASARGERLVDHDDWLSRLYNEREQLITRIRKLKVHLDDESAKHNRREWNMLVRQHSAMLEYYYSLTERCKYYGIISKDPLEDL